MIGIKENLLEYYLPYINGGKIQMTIVQAIILGLVQGVTEFLPVSSSGHLVFFQNLFNLGDMALTFDVVLHLGTLVAVVFVYRKDILDILKKPFQRTTYLIIAGIIPTIIIALLLSDPIENSFKTGKVLGVTFIITALILYFTDRYFKGDTKKKIVNMSYLDAIIVGALQGLAAFPGISRSGMTISGGLVRGVNRDNAAKYSFLLSIIAILGALVLTLKDAHSAEAAAVSVSGGAMAAGFIVAAVSGYLAIRFMLRVLGKGKFRYFAYYVGALGIYTLLDQNIIHAIFK